MNVLSTFISNQFYVVKYCISMIIEENQSSSAHNIKKQSSLNSIKQNKQSPLQEQIKKAIVKASSYLSIGRSNVISPQGAAIEAKTYSLKHKSIIMKIDKIKVKLMTPLVNLIINLERPLQKILKKQSIQQSSVTKPLIIRTQYCHRQV